MVVDRGVISPLPPWVREAEEYLRDVRLGEAWALCITQWVELEKVLNYGVQQNTRWNVTNRPVEFGPWLKWGRQYTKSPDIRDAEDYASRLLSWWHQLQPGWRRGTGTLPHHQYNGNWDTLRKGGKNGMLTVLIMFTWWGRCAAIDWQAWTAATDDLGKSLRGMIEMHEDEESGDVESRPKKRRR